MISSLGLHSKPCATAAAPVLAPVVTAISSGLAPIIFARELRIRAGGSNHRESSTRWGNFFASSERSTALMDTRGHDCVCRRIEVGCVFNFEPFLLPVGYSLDCHGKIHSSQRGRFHSGLHCPSPASKAVYTGRARSSRLQCGV